MWGVRSRSGDKKQLPTGPRATRRPGTMKTVDVSKFTVVKAGVPCQSETPIKLEWLVKLMERNEEYIYWLQPAGGGVDDQFPCVCINNKYYMLNLKLEKAIFRHVRLCRDFNNSELLEDGTRKLRIPRRLLREKLKTSCRFQVSAIPRFVCAAVRSYSHPCDCALFTHACSEQSMAPVATCRKLKRPSNRFAKKERNNDTYRKMHLSGVHDAVRVALTRTKSPCSLCTTPACFVEMLRNMYETEFPEHASCLNIELAPRRGVDTVEMDTNVV